MLATIRGNYAGSADFTRGGAGKNDNFSTFVGMCIPRQCNENDVRGLDNHFTSMAAGANWTNVSVSYSFSSRDNQAKASNFTVGPIITVVVFGMLICLGVAGSIIELTKVGDIPDLNY